MRVIAPRTAVYSGADGLSDYRTLMPHLHTLIKPGGTVYIRVPNDQSQIIAVAGLIVQHQNQYLHLDPNTLDTTKWPVQVLRIECRYVRTLQNVPLEPVIIRYKWWRHMKRMPLTHGRVLTLTYPATI